MKGPNGKYIFGTVKVGEKGQVVISKEARSVFGIKPGDMLMLVGDEKSGLALLTDKLLIGYMEDLLRANSETGTADDTVPQMNDNNITKGGKPRRGGGI